MTWTSVIVNREGEFSFSFTFSAPHDSRLAIQVAEREIRKLEDTPESLFVAAILPGRHPVYHNDLDN